MKRRGSLKRSCGGNQCTGLEAGRQVVVSGTWEDRGASGPRMGAVCGRQWGFAEADHGGLVSDAAILLYKLNFSTFLSL